MAVISRLLSRVRRRMGREFCVLSPTPSQSPTPQYVQLTPPPADVDSGHTHWQLTNVALQTGWYMLEIGHSVRSIGCVLSVSGACKQSESILLTSKPVCKRIIRLSEYTESLSVTIDSPDCTLERLVLIALTEKFAVERMRRRLQSRGESIADSLIEAEALYSEYRSHVHNTFVSKPYTRVKNVAPISLVDQSNTSNLVERFSLVLHDCSEVRHSQPNESVDAALKFAREQGWRIDCLSKDSQNNTGAENTNGERRTFHMRVCAQMQYRLEVFHQMLSGLSEDTILVYADHDHSVSKGHYSSPVLKPEWNPELLLNTNYIGCLWMIADERLNSVYSIDSLSDTQWQEILLQTALDHKCSKNQKLKRTPLSDNQVRRIPDVLGSINAKCKGCLSENWKNALENVLTSSGINAIRHCGSSSEVHRVVWSLPTKLPSVDIIIPTRDNHEVLKACIESIIQRTRYNNYRIKLFDNNSVEAVTEEYYRELQGNGRITLQHYPGEFNYSAINNAAVSYSSADVIVLLNNDTEVISKGWLDELVSQAIRREAGRVSKCMDATRRIVSP